MQVERRVNVSPGGLFGFRDANGARVTLRSLDIARVHATPDDRRVPGKVVMSDGCVITVEGIVAEEIDRQWKLWELPETPGTQHVMVHEGGPRRGGSGRGLGG